MLDWEQEESVTSPDIQEHVPQLDVILASGQYILYCMDTRIG